MIISLYKQAISEVDDLKVFLDRAEVKKAIGENYNFYRELWLQHDKKLKGELKKVSLKGRVNWLALLYIPAWYGYRKLHLEYWSLLVMISLITFYDAYNNVEILKHTKPLFAILALYSRSTYLSALIRKIKKYDALPNRERKETYSKINFDTSKKLAWIYGITYITVILSSYVIGDILGKV